MKKIIAAVFTVLLLSSSVKAETFEDDPKIAKLISELQKMEDIWEVDMTAAAWNGMAVDAARGNPLDGFLVVVSNSCGKRLCKKFGKWADARANRITKAGLTGIACVNELTGESNIGTY